MKATANYSSTAGSSSSLAISRHGNSNNYDGNKVKNSLPQRLNPKIKFKPSEPVVRVLTPATEPPPHLVFTGSSKVVDSASTQPAVDSHLRRSPPKTASPKANKPSTSPVDSSRAKPATPKRYPKNIIPPGYKKVTIRPLRLRRMAEIEVIYEGPMSAALNENRAAIRRDREAARAAFAAEKAKLHAAKAAKSTTDANSPKKSMLVKTTQIVQPSGLGQLSLDSWLKKTPAGTFVAPPDPVAAVLPPPPVAAKPSFFVVTPQVDRTQKFRNYVNALQSHFATGQIVLKAGAKRVRFLKKNARKYEDSRLFSVALPRGTVLTALTKSVEHANDSPQPYSASLDADKLFTLVSVIQFVWGIRLACKCSRTKNFDDVKNLCSSLPDFDALYGFLCTVSSTADTSVLLKPSTISVELGMLLRLLLFLLIVDEDEQDKIFNHSTQSLLVSDELLSFRFLRRLVKRQQGYEEDEAAERYKKEVKDNDGEEFEDRSADDIDLSKWLQLDSYIEQLEKDPNVTFWAPDRILGLLHALLTLVGQCAKLNSILDKLVEVTSKKRTDLYMLVREMASLKKQLATVSASGAGIAIAKKIDTETKKRSSIDDAGEKAPVAAKVSVPARRSVEPSSSNAESLPITADNSSSKPVVADERAVAALNRKMAELSERHQRLERELIEAESAIDGLRGAVRFLGFDRNQSAYFSLLDGGGAVFVNLNNLAVQQFFTLSLPPPAAGSDISSFMAYYASQYGATRVHLNVVDEAHPDELRELLCRHKSKNVFNVTVGYCGVDRSKPMPRTATLLEISNLCSYTLSSAVIRYSGLEQVKAVHAALNSMGARESQLKRSLHEFIVEQWGEQSFAVDVTEPTTTVNKAEAEENSVDVDEPTINDEPEKADDDSGTKKRVHRKIDYKFSMFEAPDFSRPDNNSMDDAEKSASAVSIGRLDDVWSRIATFANSMYERARSQYAFFNDVSTANAGGSSSNASKKKVKKLRFAQAAVWLVEPDVSAAQLVDASSNATSVGFALIEALLEYADALRADYVTEFGRQCIRYIKTHREEILGNGEQSAWLHLYLIFKLFESEGIDIPDMLTMRTRLKRRNFDEASISGSSDAGSSRASRQKQLESYDALFDNIFKDTRQNDGDEPTAVANVDPDGEENGEEEDFEAETVLRQASFDDVEKDADFRIDGSDDDFRRKNLRKRRRGGGGDSSEQSSRRSSRAGSSSRRSAVRDPAAVAAANIERQRAEREARRRKRAAADTSPPPNSEPGSRKRRARIESSSGTSSSNYSVESGQSGGSRRVLRGFVVQKPPLESVDEEDAEAVRQEENSARHRLRSSNRTSASRSDRHPATDRANDSGSSAGKRNNLTDDSDGSSVEELFQQPRSATTLKRGETSGKTTEQSSSSNVTKVNAKKMFIRS